jgi:Domain of unknown function (DUF3291)
MTGGDVTAWVVRPEPAGSWQTHRMTYQLAQVNIARLAAPLDDPVLADFMTALDPVNAAADQAPGFVWRLQTQDGNATGIQAFAWDVAGSAGVIVNLSVWADVEHLASFVYGEMHREVLRRRREWFCVMREAYAACWWVAAGHRPTTDEAEQRVRCLRSRGPTPHAFTLRKSYPAPGPDAPTPDQAVPGQAVPGRADWLCPA